MQRRTWMVVTGTMLVLVGFVPYSETVAPDWTVTTLDRAHHPLEGVTVREVWQQYSLEQVSHEEDQLTDDDGTVHFPRRTVRTSFAERFWGCLRAFGRSGAETSCGANSDLVVFGRGIDTLDWQNPGQEEGTTAQRQNSTLILDR